MNRREFITLVGGAATWPVSASAQHTAMPVGRIFKRRVTWAVGESRCIPPGLDESGMSRAGTWRSKAAGRRDDHGLPAMAADLVGRQVVVIVTYTDAAALEDAKRELFSTARRLHRSGHDARLEHVLDLDHLLGAATKRPERCSACTS